MSMDRFAQELVGRLARLEEAVGRHQGIEAPFASFPSARAYSAGTQSIGNGAWTLLSMTGERWDNATLHNTVSNTNRLTCTVPGLYLAIASIRWATNGTGTRGVRIMANGTTQVGIDYGPPTASDVTMQSCATLWPLALNDWLEIQAYQNSGGALNLDADPDTSPEFMVARLSGA